MTRNELIKRIKETAYLEGDFVLRSGKRSKYYLDKYLFETCPDILKALGKEFAKHVTDDVTLIAGAELGGVALAAALIFSGLRPDPREPRLMSLVPPVHIAVLSSAAIFPSLDDALRERRWAADMPTNLLLISGPSKTADIELTLAFGVHGPKELIVFVLDD